MWAKVYQFGEQLRQDQLRRQLAYHSSAFLGFPRPAASGGYGTAPRVGPRKPQNVSVISIPVGAESSKKSKEEEAAAAQDSGDDVESQQSAVSSSQGRKSEEERE